MTPFLSILLIAVIAAGLVGVANAYLKIHVPKTLHIGSVVNMNGTSTPSNATHTHCDVAVNINNVGYAFATPTGHADKSNFTAWTFSSGPIIKQGENRVTIKYSCLAPTNSTLPKFEYHRTVNVTGVP